MQNKDAFEWFQPFLDTGLVKLESAGSLSNGKKIWVLAKIEGNFEIIKNDIVDKYILLSNSHDGSMAVTAGFTAIRVVCNNTLSMATNSHGAKLLKVRHTESAKDDIREVRETMNIVNQTFEATAEQYRYLARKTVSKQQVEDLVKIVLSQNKTEISTRSQNQIDRMVALFENGAGNDMPGVRGTVWAAYNGITQFLSYDASANDDARQNSLWFGANNLKNKFALEECLKLAA